MIYLLYRPSDGRVIFRTRAFNTFLQPLVNASGLVFTADVGTVPTVFSNINCINYTFAPTDHTLTLAILPTPDATVALLNAQATALYRLHEAVSGARWDYTKSIVGQQQMYHLRIQQAQTYLLNSNTTDDMTLLMASANADGNSMTVEATNLVAQDDAFQQVLLHTEVAHVTEITKILAATTAAETNTLSANYNASFVTAYPLPIAPTNSPSPASSVNAKSRK